MSDEKTTEITLSKDAQKVLDLVEKLPTLDLADLVKAMEEKFGVSSAAPVAAAAAPAAGEAAAEEKSTFDVELTETGSSKINVIKAVREITGLGLAEAKGMTDGTPKILKEGVKKEEAEDMKKKLEEAGAKVTLK
jgi:large subunit ribosomal protein L7/L12